VHLHGTKQLEQVQLFDVNVFSKAVTKIIESKGHAKPHGHGDGHVDGHDHGHSHGHGKGHSHHGHAHKHTDFM